MAVTTLTQSCAMPQPMPGAADPAALMPAPNVSTLVTALSELTTSLGQLVQALQAQLAQPVEHSGCTQAQSGSLLAGDAASQMQLQGSVQAAAAPAAFTRSTTNTMFAAPDAPAVMTNAPADIGGQLVQQAMLHLGKPYQYATAGPDAFDCSGLTLAIYQKFGVKLPHKAAIQATMGTPVGRTDLRAGDLVFFANNPDGSVGHTGIYIGNNQFIHAPKTGDVVKISRLDESYYARHFSGARRYL